MNYCLSFGNSTFLCLVVKQSLFTYNWTDKMRELLQTNFLKHKCLRFLIDYKIHQSSTLFHTFFHMLNRGKNKIKSQMEDYFK